jgi:uncharacterized protein (TIGR02588 family)
MSIVSEEKSWLEWVVFAISALLILGLVVYLVKDAIQDKQRPPDLRISLGQPVPSAHGYVVPVAVANAGDETAQAVELEISTGGDKPEHATLTYDFLSSGEEREGWVGFTGKPEGRLSARVVGYRAE